MVSHCKLTHLSRLPPCTWHIYAPRAQSHPLGLPQRRRKLPARAQIRPKVRLRRELIRIDRIAA